MTTFVYLVDRPNPDQAVAYLSGSPEDFDLAERVAGGDLFPYGRMWATRDLTTFVKRFEWEPVGTVEVPDVAA